MPKINMAPDTAKPKAAPVPGEAAKQMGDNANAAPDTKVAPPIIQQK